MCSAHATVRGLLGEIVTQGDYDGDILVDMEAGLEHLSRGTGRHLGKIVAVLEPYYRSMETASRVNDLARELGVADVVVVSNKVRDEADRAAIGEFCDKRGLTLLAEIPHDPVLAEAERSGKAPIEHAPDSPAMRAVRALAGKLMLAVLCCLPFSVPSITPSDRHRSRGEAIKASASRLQPRTVIAMAAPGNNGSHQATRSNVLA